MPARAAVHCSSCPVRQNEIEYLRKQNDRLLDRVVAQAGMLQATREALETPEVDTGPAPTAREEAEEIAEERLQMETLDREAERELEAFAERENVDPSLLRDA